MRSLSLSALLTVLATAGVSAADEVVARVNFQAPGDSPAGYLVDTGLEYSETLGYGWLDDVLNKRRGVNSDLRLDTYCWVGNESPETWELALANGAYEVTLVCGSPQWTGKHTVEVEGATVLDEYATSGGEFVEVTRHAVTITDGRLSVKLGTGVYGKKTKICYLVVYAADGGGAPPPPPTPNTPPTVSTVATPVSGPAPLAVGFATTAGDDEGPVTVAWTFGDGGTATAPSPTYTYDDPGTYEAKVVVTDEGGLTAEATVTITVEEPAAPPPPPEPGGDETRVNFEAPGDSPAGYLVDTGLEFSAARGYGWLDDVLNKRRGVNSDLRLDTYCYVTNASPETWELALANGDYEVTLVCGSPQWTGKHTVQVEGTTVIDAFSTTGGEFVEVLRHPVSVSDGRLSVRIGSGVSGKKTKICYLIVHGADGAATGGGGGAPAGEPPVATATASPLSGPAPLDVDFTGGGTDDDGTVETYAWTLGDGGTAAVASPAHTYDAAGTYTATLTVTDNDGNTATASVVVTVSDPDAPPPAPTGDVTALLETDPVPTSGDAADDPAVWLHPDDAALSVVIGTDKAGRYLVGYDLDGTELWRLSEAGKPNNVDVRGDVVVCSLRDADALGVFLMDPDTRTLSKQGEIGAGVDAYGLTLYESPTTGKLYAFVSGNGGDVEQYEIALAPLTGTLVRELDTEKVEGMVADDETGDLFLAEENAGLYVYDAEPDGGQTRTQIGSIADPHLESDLEGLALYYAANDGGYLIVSVQGANEFAVYDRAAPHAYLGSFAIVEGVHDAVTDTDGIDVVNLALGPDFAKGLFIAQDGDDSLGTQTFKLVPWERIADLLGLETDTTFVPGG